MKMTNVKSLLSVALMFCSVAAIAQPQRGGRPDKCHKEVSSEEMVQERCDKIAEKLELTDNQKAEFMKITAEHNAERKQKAAKYKEQMAERREQAKTQREAHLSEIMALLNDDQKVKFAAMLSEQGHKNKPQGAKGGRGAKGKMAPAKR